MNQHFKYLKSLLILSVLLLPWTNVHSLEKFWNSGELSQINSSYFKVNDQRYWLRTGTKLENPSKERPGLSDLKSGDFVYFRGTILDNRFYVDSLTYTPEPLL